MTDQLDSLDWLNGQGRALDIVYLEFSKAFNTNFLNILISKLIEYGLGKWTKRWTEKWPNCQTQRDVTGSMKSAGGKSLVVYPRGL